MDTVACLTCSWNLDKNRIFFDAVEALLSVTDCKWKRKIKNEALHQCTSIKRSGSLFLKEIIMPLFVDTFISVNFYDFQPGRLSLRINYF